MKYGKKKDFKEGGKLTISNKSVKVDPPEGYHWMEEGGRYYLMKGEYEAHDASVKQASFKIADHPKGFAGMLIGPALGMAKKIMAK